MGHAHPSPPSPRQSLGKARAGRVGIPACPKGKGLHISGLTYKREEGWELVYAQGGNKAMWGNNKYFLSIYLFFFSPFSYILLAYRFCQYVSYIYYIYLYISTMPLSLGDPQRLKKPLKHGALGNFPFQLRVFGWRLGFRHGPDELEALRPNACLLPSAHGQSGSAGEPKAEGGRVRPQ